MADNDKKGTRDISDLKARLGLKNKPGAAPGPAGAAGPPVGTPAPVPSAAQAPIPAPAAVAPRPAANLPPALTGIPSPGAVPPPPGFQAPVEAAPPPDPRRDPFAAQQAAAAANLAAFYGINQQLPGDANAVAEEVKKPKPWGLIGGAVAIGLVALGVGYASGSISVSRNDYNETTEQAGKIRQEVEKIQKSVAEVATLIKEANPQGGVNFAAIEKIKSYNLQEPDVTSKLFKTNYYSFEIGTTQQLFTYYNDVIVLARQLQVHGLRSANDQKALEAFIKANTGGSKGDKRLGIILDMSQRAPFSQLVELVGAPICPNGAGDCPAKDMKMQFRSSTGGAPQTRAISGKPETIVFPMQPTELQQQLLTGDTNMLAMESYRRRTKDIVDTLARLAETEKQLIGNLKKRAEAGKLWTLF